MSAPCMRRLGGWMGTAARAIALRCVIRGSAAVRTRTHSSSALMSAAMPLGWLSERGAMGTGETAVSQEQAALGPDRGQRWGCLAQESSRTGGLRNPTSTSPRPPRCLPVQTLPLVRYCTPSHARSRRSHIVASLPGRLVLGAARPLSRLRALDCPPQPISHHHSPPTAPGERVLPHRSHSSRRARRAHPGPQRASAAG